MRGKYIGVLQQLGEGVVLALGSDVIKEGLQGDRCQVGRTVF